MEMEKNKAQGFIELFKLIPTISNRKGIFVEQYELNIWLSDVETSGKLSFPYGGGYTDPESVYLFDDGSKLGIVNPAQRAGKAFVYELS